MYPCLNPRTVGIALDWDDCLPLAKENGFEGIDLWMDAQVPAAHYREALAQYGLKAGGMGLPVHVNDSEEKFAAGLADLPAFCERAQAAGVTRLYTWIPPFSEQRPWKENFRFHVDRMGKAARILEEYGCRLGLEFIGPKTLREDRRYSFVHTMEGMLELAEAVGPNAGLLLDAYHWYTSLGTLSELRGLDNQQVVYVHVNDAPAGVPVDQQQDLVRRLPGATGVIDLAGFLDALRHIGYDGPVVAEPFVPELKELPAAEAARQVGESMLRIWGASRIA